MLLLDPFDTAPPQLIPPWSLQTVASVKIAITTNEDIDEVTADGNTVQGVLLSAAANDVVLLTGQDDPAENGFYGVDTGGGVRYESVAQFIRAVGPNDELGYYAQWKVGVTAGTNAGKTYFLATPAPCLLDNGVQILELTEGTPRVNNAGNYDLAPPELRPLDTDAPFDRTYVCKAALSSNAALPLASGPITVDGIELEVGDYYLLKLQTTQAQNGVYVVSAGAPAKAQATGLVRARITEGTSAGKQFSVNQATGVVTSLAPAVIT